MKGVVAAVRGGESYVSANLMHEEARLKNLGNRPEEREGFRMRCVTPWEDATEFMMRERGGEKFKSQVQSAASVEILKEGLGSTSSCDRDPLPLSITIKSQFKLLSFVLKPFDEIHRVAARAGLESKEYALESLIPHVRISCLPNQVPFFEWYPSHLSSILYVELS